MSQEFTVWLNENLPLIGAISLAKLHLLLAMKMSTQWRLGFVQMANKFDGETQIQNIKDTDRFKVNERTQLNIAEYSGVLIAILLYIQYQMNRTGVKLSKTAKASIYMTVLGSYAFAFGFLQCKTPSQTNLIKFTGAISRYTGFMGLIYVLYLISKNKL